MRPQVVELTRRETVGASVELVRCTGCGLGSWRLGGADVPKERALAALSAAFTSTAPRAPRPARMVRPQADPAERGPELADLLAGWRVLGAS